MKTRSLLVLAGVLSLGVLALMVRHGSSDKPTTSDWTEGRNSDSPGVTLIVDPDISNPGNAPIISPTFPLTVEELAALMDPRTWLEEDFESRGLALDALSRWSTKDPLAAASWCLKEIPIEGRSRALEEVVGAWGV